MRVNFLCLCLLHFTLSYLHLITQQLVNYEMNYQIPQLVNYVSVFKCPQLSAGYIKSSCIILLLINEISMMHYFSQ